MSDQPPHVHGYKAFRYVVMPIDNAEYNGKGKRVLKLAVCECGDEIGKDLLDAVPEGET